MALNLDVDSLSADLPRKDQSTQMQNPGDDKSADNGEHVEHFKSSSIFEYDDMDHEPKLHVRTWVALASMVLFNLVVTLAVLSPASVLSYIGANLGNTTVETWIPTALLLVQVVFAPVLASIADVFQIRKPLLLLTLVIAFIGAGIAPGSHSIYRLIGTQMMIGFGAASIPLGYSIPSEILPRRWRPMGQAVINFAGALGAVAGPLIIGAFTENDRANGWRKFYWVQMGLWGAAAIGILAGYRPLKVHTSLDQLSLWQKLGHLDFIGITLLAAGLSLLLVGLNLGGGIYDWSDAPVVVTLVLGVVILITFGVYEWKGTKTGIFHPDLFSHGREARRNFLICVSLIFAEGILLFTFGIFYPVLTTTLFETDPMLSVARQMPFWVGCLLSTGIWGWAGTRFRTIREPLCAGFLVFTAGIVGFATIQPTDSTNAIVFAGVAGIGFGAAIVLIVAGVQLSTPHHLINTATAITVSSRAVAASMFTAIYSAALTTGLKKKTPAYVAAAALQAGLAPSGIPAFVTALASGDTAALSSIPNINPAIIEAGVTALKQAFADSIRVVFIIGASFGGVACVACLFIGDLKSTMNYHVDAPVEDLSAKNKLSQG